MVDLRFAQIFVDKPPMSPDLRLVLGLVVVLREKKLTFSLEPLTFSCVDGSAKIMPPE